MYLHTGGVNYLRLQTVRAILRRRTAAYCAESGSLGSVRRPTGTKLLTCRLYLRLLRAHSVAREVHTSLGPAELAITGFGWAINARVCKAFCYTTNSYVCGRRVALFEIFKDRGFVLQQSTGARFHLLDMKKPWHMNSPNAPTFLLTGSDLSDASTETPER